MFVQVLVGCIAVSMAYANLLHRKFSLVSKFVVEVLNKFRTEYEDIILVEDTHKLPFNKLTLSGSESKGTMIGSVQYEVCDCPSKVCMACREL